MNLLYSKKIKVKDSCVEKALNKEARIGGLLLAIEILEHAKSLGTRLRRPLLNFSLDVLNNTHKSKKYNTDATKVLYEYIKEKTYPTKEEIEEIVYKIEKEMDELIYSDFFG